MAINEIQIIGLETIYTLLVIIPSLIVYFKISKIYAFSNYKGLKYFGNAFLFLAIGFILRYVVMIQKVLGGDLFETIQRFDFMVGAMEYFMILSGMLLFYSLAWKFFEKNKYSQKPINLPIILISILTLIIVIIDLMLRSLIMLYVSQIILFSAAAIIAYKNYIEKKQYFKRFYFVAMILFLIIAITNMIAQYTIDAMPIIRFYAYFITVVVIWIFLYTTIKIIELTPSNQLPHKIENETKSSITKQVRMKKKVKKSNITDNKTKKPKTKKQKS